MSLIHGLRVGFCDVLGGSEHFALGPAAGALLAGAFGTLAGEATRRIGPKRRRLVAVILGVLGPLGSIGVSLGRFYGSPMVFAYDPFVGYFSGSFYDTVIDFSGLASYRAGTFATLVAAVCLAACLRREGNRLRLSLRPSIGVLGLAAASGSALAMIEGDRLGHWHTPSSIEKILGGRSSGSRCDVVHPRGMKPADVTRFVAECDAHVVAGEAWFGAPGPQRVTAFLFESSSQKAALMGAADTYIAKPWRREVYVQSSGFPHPVLGHEVMHVLAGAFGQGPFKIAGSLGGVLPNPGLIEGVAVAAAPKDGDLLPKQWAKAMKDLNILPSLDRLFGLGFLGENSSIAYTVSGAFVEWVHDTFGAQTIRDWYGGKTLPELTHASWSDLEKRWQRDLDTLVLPEAARTQAKARFDRPALFGRRCPHVVDACKGQADRLRGAGDEIGARAVYQRILELDPHDFGAKIGIARSLVRGGHLAEGIARLDELSRDKELSRAARDRALEDLADQKLAAGDDAGAEGLYREIIGRMVDEDQIRNLELKAFAARDPRAREAVVALLVGSPGKGADRTLGLELLGRWEATPPPDGLPLYLLGRQHQNAGELELAADRFDRALALPLPLERIRVETERLRLVIACALGDGAGAARFHALYAAHEGVSEARRAAADALIDRCTRGAVTP